ncbi:MAG: SRPBCC domain-containing protein [Rhodococcus sp. (in: high G+C Gram-positive bacteria)]|uniref:SRPBCC family protein n=1 Tax=Rhodococcus sp. TaxID=1831 RepID=UPI003BAEDDA8
MTEKSFRYQIAVADLFSLLISEDAAGQWMGAVVELEPEAGGVVVVAAPGWPVVSGHVESIRQPDSVTFVWRAPDWPGPLRTVITLEPEADGARLRLTETGYGTDDDLLRTRDYLWSHWLVRLAATGAQYRPGGGAGRKYRK